METVKEVLLNRGYFEFKLDALHLGTVTIWKNGGNAVGVHVQAVHRVTGEVADLFFNEADRKRLIDVTGIAMDLVKKEQALIDAGLVQSEDDIWRGKHYE